MFRGGEVVFSASPNIVFRKISLTPSQYKYAADPLELGARQLAASCQMSMILMNLPCTRDGLDQDPY